jgi:hypothetical protein
MIGFEPENWRRRPDLNRGWRFCRFNEVVIRVVSCWSLVGPAPWFWLVLGRYWTTNGLQTHRTSSHRVRRPRVALRQVCSFRLLRLVVVFADIRSARVTQFDWSLFYRIEDEGSVVIRMRIVAPPRHVLLEFWIREPLIISPTVHAIYNEDLRLVGHASERPVNQRLKPAVNGHTCGESEGEGQHYRNRDLR